MKMHQFAFVQKCPALTSTALPPSPPKRPVDVKRGKSEYVESPQIQTQTTQETSGTFRQVPTRRVLLSFGECAYSDLRDIFS